MRAKISTALFVAMLIVIQPVFAQDNVIVLDLEYATDEELTGAMDAATELELIMRTEWEVLGEYEAEEQEVPAEEPVLAVEAEEPEYYAEEPELVADAEEPEYYAEEPELVAEVEEPEYYAEEPELVAEAEEPEYYEEPELVAEVEELEYYAEEPVLVAEVEEQEYPAEEAVAGTLDNRYFLESQRLVRLAEEAYEQGDYEAAAAYAQEASRYALLSDEYIAGHAGDDADVVAVADYGDDEGYPLPATFTVRSWDIYRDCLWNIAGHPDVYGDPLQWPVLFNANRHRMPNPNNPDLILPGMVLEIPSIDGEVREGAWQSGRVYRRR